MRMRTWCVWVFAPVVLVILSVVVVCWEPVPKEKIFGQELVLEGDLRIALPLQSMHVDMLLDGGSIVFQAKDRAGVIHQLACRFPGFDTIWHHSSAVPSENGGYGVLISNDADVRNLFYYSAHRLKAGRTWGHHLMIGYLYPSLLHRWFL
jgi:hypothetical protein